MSELHESLAACVSDDAEALWRVAEQMLKRAAEIENDARRLREQARRLSALAAAVNDGRPLEHEC